MYRDLSRRTGATVLSSSRGGEFSYESSEVEGGFFTHALVEALTNGKADINHDGWIDSRELATRVADAVAKRSHGLQNPSIDRENLNKRIALPAIQDE